MKKLHVHWTSKIPLRYKRNAIIGKLYRAKKIASNFDTEIKRIVNKYIAARIPVIDNFNNGNDDLIMHQWLLEKRKAFTISQVNIS